MKIGDKLAVQTIGNAARNGRTRAFEVTVSNVGRKFFYVEELDGVKFFKDTRRQQTNFSANYMVFDSLKAIEVSNKSNILIEKIRKKIGGYGETSIPLDTLERIANYLEIE